MSEASGPGRLPRALRPFRHRGYRLLAASLAMSLFATGIWLVATVLHVVGAGGGPSDVSLVAAAAGAGLLVSVLTGGLVADRFGRVRVLRAVEVVRVLVTGVAAVLALGGTLSFGGLAVLAFVVGAAEAFYFPSWSALLPTVLPADELLAASGVEQALRPAATQAAGPALAGALVGAFAPTAALAAACLAYLGALVPLLAPRIAAGAPVTDGGGGSVLGDAVDAVRYLLRTGWLFASVSFATLYVLVIIGPIEVLLVFAVRDGTGSGPGAYSLVLVTYGIGGILGSVVVASRPMPRRYLTTMLLLWGFGAVPLMLVGVTDQPWVMAAATFVDGVTNSAAGVIWGTLLQRRVPSHMLGRVSGLDAFVSLAFLPVSMALAGPLGEAFGVTTVFLAVGAIAPVLAVVALLAFRLPRDETAHPLS